METYISPREITSEVYDVLLFSYETNVYIYGSYLVQSHLMCDHDAT